MPKSYLFGQFRMEPEQELLWRDLKPISLEPRVFAVLKLLVEEAPGLVTHDRLKTLWPDQQDQSLFVRSANQAIYMLRQKLADDIIRSRPKRGWELVPKVLRRDPDLAPSEVEPSALSALPKQLILSTKRTNPQLADFGYYLAPRVPWRLRCRVSTKSPYFRFGFKLVALRGALFADTTVQSADPSVVVHIGRNDWDRPSISKRDIFVTAYQFGRLLDVDKRVGPVPRIVSAPIELRVSGGHELRLLFDGRCCFRHAVTPDICQQVAILAWGDTTDFEVSASDVTFSSVGPR
jgi:DNA-binding winged helix-turn-helix (wHTH) protein